MLEVVVSAAISSIVLFASVTMFMGVMGAWARGESTMDGENDTRQAMRVISDELREAMWVLVDADGMGLTYRKPAKDVNGEFLIPVTWDGFDRRIYYENGILYLEKQAGERRPICRNVLTRDPYMLHSNMVEARREQSAVAPTAAPQYQIFEPNSTSITTEVTVMIVTGQSGGQVGETVRSRKRESIALRNVPELIK